MKATYLEFNDDCTKIKRTKIEVNFASNDTPPALEIILPPVKSKMKVHRAVYIYAKDVLTLILGRVIDKLKEI